MPADRNERLTLKRVAPELLKKLGLKSGWLRDQRKFISQKKFKLRGLDLNQRPLGYEPNELPDCSTPLFHYIRQRHN